MRRVARAGSRGQRPLALDVMTPHHPQWQAEEAAPTDFDAPVPVAFLSVSATFRVRVSWCGPRECAEATRWTDLALRLLTEALERWGVGGKTSSGYGRLGSCEDAAPLVVVPAVRMVARKPLHKPGDSITVTRTADPKPEKNRKWFVADDGYGGVVTHGQPPELDLEQTLQVEVAAVHANGYNFRMPRQPQQKKPDPRPSQG